MSELRSPDESVERQQSLDAQNFDDCDGCGERFWDADRRTHLARVELHGEIVSLCVKCLREHIAEPEEEHDGDAV